MSDGQIVVDAADYGLSETASRAENAAALKAAVAEARVLAARNPDYAVSVKIPAGDFPLEADGRGCSVGASEGEGMSDLAERVEKWLASAPPEAIKEIAYRYASEGGSRALLDIFPSQDDTEAKGSPCASDVPTEPS